MAGSWWQLATVLAAIRQEARTPQPSNACPNCGWPLKQGPRGVRYCPHGDYRSDAGD